MLPILILHGWGSCAKNWQRVKELLESRGYRVFVPDLPGFGENPPLSKVWTIDDYVAWVKAFADKNNLSQFFLLGHSFGGATAIQYAIKYPQDVEKLFLVAPSYLRRKTSKIIVFAVIAKIFKIFSFLPFYTIFRKAFYKFIIRKSDYPHATGVLKESYLKIIKEDLSSVVSSIRNQTIIIWGDKDDTTPIKNAYLLNEKVKGSKLVIIEGEDHDLERRAPELLVEKIIKNI